MILGNQAEPVSGWRRGVGKLKERAMVSCEGRRGWIHLNHGIPGEYGNLRGISQLRGRTPKLVNNSIEMAM